MENMSSVSFGYHYIKRKKGTDCKLSQKSLIQSLRVKPVEFNLNQNNCRGFYTAAHICQSGSNAV